MELQPWLFLVFLALLLLAPDITCRVTSQVGLSTAWWLGMSADPHLWADLLACLQTCLMVLGPSHHLCICPVCLLWMLWHDPSAGEAPALLAVVALDSTPLRELLTLAVS